MGMMSDAQVSVPGVGHVKKQYVMIGAAVVVGIVGYAWWHRQNAAPADVPAYGEGDVSADGIADTAGGSAGGSANSGGGSTDTSTTPDNDQEWAQQANEALSGAYDAGALAVALGRYLTHQTLTADQANMVSAAIGLIGYPPGGHYPMETGGGSTPSALTEPKGLKKTASTATTITLEWTAVAGAAGYRAYRSDVADNVGASVDTKVTVGGLAPGKAYTFHVRATDSAGKLGPSSSNVTASTTSAKLTAPKSLHVTSTAKTSIGLAWAPVAGADGYRLYRKGVAQSVGASRDTSATVGGLHPNTTYTFYVAATAGNTTGPKSSGKGAKTRK